MKVFSNYQTQTQFLWVSYALSLLFMLFQTDDTASSNVSQKQLTAIIYMNLERIFFAGKYRYLCLILFHFPPFPVYSSLVFFHILFVRLTSFFFLGLLSNSYSYSFTFFAVLSQNSNFLTLQFFLMCLCIKSLQFSFPCFRMTSLLFLQD